MLIIRAEQMSAFQGAIQEQFLDRLVQLILSRFPDHLFVQGRKRAFLARMVSDFVAEAGEFGITAAPALADYVGLKFGVGIDFHRHWLVRTVLQDSRIQPNSRIDHLMLFLDSTAWSEVRKFCEETEAQHAVEGR
jgi:hypothetical protein